MGLQAVTWFEVEKHTNLLNALLFFFDDIYVPNFLWLETGSKFEPIFLKLSDTKNEIDDVVIAPGFLVKRDALKILSWQRKSVIINKRT